MRGKLLLIFAFISITINAQISQTERQALIDFYNATDGANWTNNTNWNTDINITSDVSNWYGVTVTEINGQDYVTEINLSNNNLNGSFSSLVNLSNITSVDFSENMSFSGGVNFDNYAATIDNVKLNNTGITSLKLHKYVTLNIKDVPNLNCVEVPSSSINSYHSLSMNNFDLGIKITDNCSGVLPLDATEKAALKAIFNTTNGTAWSYNNYGSTEIVANTNPEDLRGIVTKDFGTVRRITKLFFHGMGLNGGLPVEIGDFSELLELKLSQNQISSIPNEIGGLSKLNHLDVSINNTLTTIPSTVGDLVELISLKFNTTQVDLLPTTIENLLKLEILELGSTKITLLPPQIGNLAELTRLVAAPNNIASIPTELGQLSKLTYLDFSNCKLSNTPTAFANLTNLETLYLNNNELQVVAGLGGFTKLKHLRLHNNRLGEDNPNFNTDLPEDLSDLVLLEELTLYSNQLTKLPSNIGALLNLTSLKIYNNRLTFLPNSIGNLTDLKELQVQGNELTSLPATIGGLTNLEKLYLSQSSNSNKIATLPAEIGDLSNLKELYLENMQTYDSSTGTYTYYLTSLPSTMNQLTNLEVLEAENNEIGGLVDLTNVIKLKRLQLNNNKIEDLKIDAPVINFSLSSNPTYHFNISNNPYLSCVEVPTAEVTNWETRYAQRPQIADNGIAFSDSCSGFRVPQSEREALVALYIATNGGDKVDATIGVTWVGTNWSSDATELTNVGSWQGVTTEIINGQKHVTKIELISNQLSGVVPKEIADLPELTLLNLSSGKITSVATEIGGLSKLTHLNLSSNSLESLPVGIGDFTSLVELNLSYQRINTNTSQYTSTLTTLPNEIGNIATLEKLDLSYNGLTSLPSGIGNFTSLKELRLNNQTTSPVRYQPTNTLSSLPDEIGNITSLEKLYLQNNIIANIPSTINGLTSLKELQLQGNELTSLPATIGGLTNLEKLYLSQSSNSNKIATLPAEIGDLSNLKELYLENMQTYDSSTGTYTYYLTSLPSTMNQLTNLEVLEAENNEIGGLVDLTNVIKLKRLQLNNNKITDLKIDAPVINFSLSSNPTYHFNISNNPYLSCVEVPTAEVTNWETRYAQRPQIADNGIAFSDSCSGFRVPQSEREALVALYIATNGGDKVDATTGVTWVGTNWSSDATELTNVGSWQGVTTEIINGQKHVTKIELISNQLSGVVPKEIADLPELTLLNLSSGKITSIATEIGGLSKLTHLNLSSNSLESLPVGIGDFTSLVELNLSYQRINTNTSQYTSTLTTLPNEIGNIATLEKLDLSYNGLTSLPSGIGNFTSLKELRLNNQTTSPVRYQPINTLSSLPDEIGNITSLEKLYLQNNIIANIPSTINGLTSLKELQVQGNELTSLPATIGGLTNLEKLYLSQSSNSNKIATLPAEIGDLSNLKELYLENMQTYDSSTGTYTYYLTSLPSTMNQLTNLEVLEAENNEIGGLVDLTNVIKLKRLQLNNNKITDLKIDAPVINFSLSSNPTYHFNISNNPYLSCVEVPTAEVTNWETRYAQRPQIADNGIAFSDSCSGFRVPQSEREALVALYIATNGGDKVDATIGVTWVGTNWSSDATELTNVGSWQGVTTEIINGQKHVTKIELISNQLSGVVPKEIADLPELTLLNLSSGKITSIATEIGGLSKLTHLNLSSNSLESLPVGIGDFTSLVELNLSYQRINTNTSQYTSTLTTLPNEIGNIATLEKLDLSYNGLTSLPSGIGNFTSLKELRLNNQTTSPVRYQPTNTLNSLPDEIGNIVSLEKLYLQGNVLESLPSTMTNLILLETFNISNNRISGSINLGLSEVLNDFRADFNNISELKIAVAPTIFGTNTTNPRANRLRLNRNALGCVEVPSDELVAWQLSNYKEEGGIIDNGVVYSDNCNAVTTNSIPDLEREALIALYNSTKGMNWRNDLSSSYNGVVWETDSSLKRNVGAWFGVTTEVINGQKHVTKVELNSNELDGTIPSVIKNLIQLKELELNSNFISEIPTEIGELANLEQLTFNNQYNSNIQEYVLNTIPVEINNISSLKRLELSSNQLEGNLDFSNLTNLISLNVSGNEITGLKIGVAPSNFDNSYNSEEQFSNTFIFYNQYLNCISVPENTILAWEATSFASQYSNIVWGQDCSAYNNVPENEIKALVDLYNNLEGANWTNNTNWNGNLAKALINNPYNATKWQGITTKIVDGGKHITNISLNSNKLKGELPESIGNLTKLTNLQIGSNEISGAIPSTFGNLASLETLYLNSNKITSLPTEMSNMLALKTVYLQNNEIKGNLPDFTNATNLTSLYISSNKFQFGDFENEFIDYQNLQTFSYSNQAKVGVEETVDFGDGYDKTLVAIVSGTNNMYQWYKNGSPITDATSKEYVITDATQQDAGYYFCLVSNPIITGFNIETQRVTLNYDETLSVNKEIVLSNYIKLYPNPVKDVLQIQNINNVNIKKIEVYNLLGKRLQLIKNPINKINISNLSEGVYLLKIDTAKGNIMKRIMKK
ncbi:hypothetical protein BXQ17_08820 [Polaribacter sp. BM10]|uniref:leucine-rich repeat domain-containing protein n=1 Tax=Polaribacter sp. BM10 TaxID=1529069 RepID=UPI000989C4C7|nr:leucine-rich repeat domain-containing protein [Polaribacter sp. BM10]AQS94157.1 hypothetical protein BXQ17_08820 [Polaribacter sp. BM10]